MFREARSRVYMWNQASRWVPDESRSWSFRKKKKIIECLFPDHAFPLFQTFPWGNSLTVLKKKLVWTWKTSHKKSPLTWFLMSLQDPRKCRWPELVRRCWCFRCFLWKTCIYNQRLSFLQWVPILQSFLIMEMCSSSLKTGAKVCLFTTHLKRKIPYQIQERIYQSFAQHYWEMKKQVDGRGSSKLSQSPCAAKLESFECLAYGFWEFL